MTITNTHIAPPEARGRLRHGGRGGAGRRPPSLHTHPAHEFFWTLSGRLTYFRDDGADGITEISGGPGTSAFIPGGVPHT